MTLPLQKKLFTVQDYHKMREVDILTSEDHVELINGEMLLINCLFMTVSDSV